MFYKAKHPSHSKPKGGTVDSELLEAYEEWLDERNEQVGLRGISLIGTDNDWRRQEFLAWYRAQPIHVQERLRQKRETVDPL